jgi:16S rRNA G1207 methylase RsmC
VLDTLTLPMQTARGLPEFDALSYETELLVKVLQDMTFPDQTKALVFNPGQGHMPAVLWRMLEPASIDMVDRDLLSLRYSALNLAANDCPTAQLTTAHQVALAPSAAAQDRRPGLIVGRLREDEGTEAIEQSLMEAAAHLAPEGQMLIAGGSTPITRVLKSQAIGDYLRPVKRKRKKGNSVALLERR